MLQLRINDQIIHQLYIIIIFLNLGKYVPCFLLFFQFQFLFTIDTCNFYNVHEAHAQLMRESE